MKSYDKKTKESLISLIKADVFGCGALTCKDIYATYEVLKSKGVEFIKASTNNFIEQKDFLKKI